MPCAASAGIMRTGSLSIRYSRKIGICSSSNAIQRPGRSTGLPSAAKAEHLLDMAVQTLSRRLAAEFIGTAFLLAAVVGSGIMAERLAGGNSAIALLANSIATACALFVLILMFAPVSGAHFNPVVTFAAVIDREFSVSDAGRYLICQLFGAIFGVATANLMFGLPVMFASTKVRTDFGQWLGEFVASLGLIGTIVVVTRRFDARTAAVSVAAYIAAAYWFTSSTSFANPAVTIARCLTDTFTGIRPEDVPAFILAQMFGGLSGYFIFNWLVPKQSE